MNRKITDELKQILQKPIVIYSLIALLIAGGAYGAVSSFSSAPSDKEEPNGGGLLKSIPQGQKKKIYDKAEAIRKAEERSRMKSIHGRNDNWSDGMMGLIDHRKVELPEVESHQEASRRLSQQSANEVREAVSSFYRQQEEQPDNHLLDQNEKLRRELDLIRQREKIAAEQARIAQQAMGVVQSVAASQEIGGNAQSSSVRSEAQPAGNSKLLAMAVAPSGDRTVSSLSSQDQEEQKGEEPQESNTGFYTAVGNVTALSAKNTIRAIVEQTQVVRANQTVQLRLKEEVRIGEKLVPRNSILVAEAALRNDRLELTVKSVAHEGSIYAVTLSAYDNDGQRGLYVPGSMEANAVQEIAANSGDAIARGGMTFSTQGAGTQIAADAARGVLSGASQYMKKKIREVKITLKAGTEIFLLPSER